MTIRELLKKAVDGLKKDFLSQGDKERLVEYILDNSNLFVLDNRVELRSYNQFGVGVNNKDREIPYEVDYILFSWIKASDGEGFLGLKKNWVLESFLTFEDLDERLSASYLSVDIEYVVLIQGDLQPYKTTQNNNPFSRKEIFWENIKPYRLTYSSDKKSMIEFYDSKVELENTVLELYEDEKWNFKDNNFFITIDNIFDEEQYGFMLTGESFSVDIDGNKEVKQPVFVWCSDSANYPF